MALSPQELVEYRVVFAYQKGRRPILLVLECSDDTHNNSSEPIREWLGVAKGSLTTVHDLTNRGAYDKPTNELDNFLPNDMGRASSISRSYPAATPEYTSQPSADILSQDTPTPTDFIGNKFNVPKPK